MVSGFDRSFCATKVLGELPLYGAPRHLIHSLKAVVGFAGTKVRFVRVGAIQTMRGEGPERAQSLGCRRLHE
jgi:hypothetical protein